MTKIHHPNIVQFLGFINDPFIISFEDLPLADAGNAQIVGEGSVVTLDGSRSSNPRGGELSYAWKAPEGIILSSETDVQPTFVAPEVDEDTVYEVKLVVNDGMVDSEESTVEVLVKHVNKAPIADAGESLVVTEGGR